MLSDLSPCSPSEGHRSNLRSSILRRLGHEPTLRAYLAIVVAGQKILRYTELIVPCQPIVQSQDFVPRKAWRCKEHLEQYSELMASFYNQHPLSSFWGPNNPTRCLSKRLCLVGASATKFPLTGPLFGAVCPTVSTIHI